MKHINKKSHVLRKSAYATAWHCAKRHFAETRVGQNNTLLKRHFVEVTLGRKFFFWCDTLPTFYFLRIGVIFSVLSENVYATLWLSNVQRNSFKLLGRLSRVNTNICIMCLYFQCAFWILKLFTDFRICIQIDKNFEYYHRDYFQRVLTEFYKNFIKEWQLEFIWASSWENVSLGIPDQVWLKLACPATEAS